jgi:beta-glucanase (GH16 family)
MTKHVAVLLAVVGIGVTLFVTAPSTGVASPPGAASEAGSGVPVHRVVVATNPNAAARTACGGRPILVDHGVRWTCTFDSEFTGQALDPSQWRIVSTSTSAYSSGQTACFVDSPNNVSVGKGYLSLTARKEASPFVCSDPAGSYVTQYTSGYVTTFQRFSQTYGRFEVVAKVPPATVPGLQSSFWLFPVNESGYGPWPSSGEIDIAESYSEYPNRAIPYVHYSFDPLTISPWTNTNVVTNQDCVIDQEKFNDYVLEWTPTTMTLIFNGQTCLVDRWVPSSPLHSPEPFDRPFFVNLTQALGINSNVFDPAATPLPATTEVKCVRVWGATF